MRAGIQRLQRCDVFCRTLRLRGRLCRRRYSCCDDDRQQWDKAFYDNNFAKCRDEECGRIVIVIIVKLLCSKGARGDEECGSNSRCKACHHKLPLLH